MTQIAGTMTEAGKRYGISRWTMQTHIRAGLPFIKTGRKSKMIIFSEMDAWFKSRQIRLKGKP